jgi:septal ring factor EnvC (AmiA/AmiB activator)
MSFRRRTHPRRIAAVVAVAAVILATAAAAPVRPDPASATTIDQLNSQLSHQHARQQTLSASVNSLSGLIGSLQSQISLVQSREADVRSALAESLSSLLTVQAALRHERAHLVVLRRRLARARMLLSRQLVSSYEGDRPDIVTVVLDARGFTDLLEKIDFLHRAEQQQQAVIVLTRTAKAQADAAARKLAKDEATDRQVADSTAVRARALAGMNSLLSSRESALAQARAAQQAALSASRARGRQLQSQISRLQAQQAAARAAAQAAAAAGSSGTPFASSPALGPSGGWAIPYAIVLCESGGQNLPPNSAGASGYYQIIPSTWASFGGTGPAAYLASKAEQDAVASRIWNNGAGASNWTCAGIVGIH